MKRVTTALLAALVLTGSASGCRVEKTGDDGYRVGSDPEQAERAAERTREAGRELAEQTREAGATLEQGAREVAQKTGTALEKAGKELQEHARPGDQK